MTRILYICSSWPHGGTFGGQLRALHIGRALQQIGKTTVILVGSEAGDSEALSKTAEEFEVQPPVLPGLSYDPGVLEKLRRAFRTRHMNLHGYLASHSDRARIESLARDADLVWVLNSRTPNILHRWRWPCSHLDVDDLPSTFQGTLNRSGTTLTQRWKARVQQILLHRRERRFLQRFTTLSVCSRADRAYLGDSDRIHVIPNGFKRPEIAPVRNPSETDPRLGFIGLYSYTPNVEGVRWFLTNCWPAVRREVPGIRFRLIGKDTDGPLKPTEPNVDALGWIADPASEIGTWAAMIIPIRVGSGTRIKIAEAFSRRCPAVSTSLGAFGYEVENGRQIRLADNPEDFANACINAVRDPAGASAMAERAWNDFLEKWTWDAISPKVWNAAEDCLRRSDPGNKE